MTHLNKLLSLSAISLGLISANAWATGPTIYGSLELAVAHTDQGRAVNPNPNGRGVVVVTNPESGTFLENNWSYVGFKGSEKLNDDFSVIYQMEVSVQDGDIAGVEDPISSRSTFLGFDTSWGTLMFGRADTAFYNAEGNTDIFDNTNAWMAQLMPGEDRQSNSFNYVSPNFGSQQFALSGTVLMEDNNSTSDYPFSVAATLGDMDLESTIYFVSAAYSKDIEDFKGYRGAAQVRFGDLKLGGIFQNAKHVTLQNIDGNMYYVNAQYNLNKLNLHSVNIKAMYGQDQTGLGDYFQGIVDLNSEITDVRVQQLTLGADYHASQAAIFYAFWANYKTDYNLKTVAQDVGTENVYTLGLRYYF
ncbi:porin [Shewanella sp. NIFS-20-20]|uniref:porin n=1 Tax=Shewanella sp. NIFS-20-20 TaxID=2853806 RepID=UPI001C455B81|nr:porin [Shewanella sp. NIFS-20-20]MBV7317406.1 porin [Shewanella sp. NIFS-20-20]